MSPLELIHDLLNFCTYAVIVIIQELLFRHYYRNRTMKAEEEENIEGDVVVVTGASRGMGAQISELLAKRGATVVLGCVEMDEGEETVKNIKRKTGNENVELIYLDLGDLASVQNFAAEINRKYPKIRILFNNGGIGGGRKQTKTKDGLNITMAVNYFGHFLLTNLLLENLKRGKPSRGDGSKKIEVISMSSVTQLLQKLDINDIHMETSGYGLQNEIPYVNSKYALALFTKELGHRMLGTGVTTYALCPGLVKTAINDHDAKLAQIWNRTYYTFLGFTAEEAASDSLLYHAVSKRIAHETGIMYRFKRHFTRANKNLKDSLAKELWDVSANLVQLEQRLKKHQEYRTNM